MYVKHLAWLQAAPDLTEAEAKAGKKKKPRMEVYTKGHGYSFMPQVTANYLLSELQNAGLAKSGANGIEPLSWTELKAYVDLTDSALQPWECEAMIEVSRTYVRSYHAASDNTMPPPYVTENEDELEQHQQWVIENDEALSRS